MLDFSTLTRPATPNTALRADPGDTPSEADGPAVRLSVPPSSAIAAWDAVVRAAPRTTVVAFDGLAHHAVQRSRVFRFPDDIHAQAVPDGAGSRLLVYAAARYGKGDLGVNRRRVERWVDALPAALRA